MISKSSKDFAKKMGDGKLSRMEKKLGNGDVIYSDSFWGDFWFYLKNNHIFFAICCAHPENPNTKLARFIAFLASIVLAMCLAAIAGLSSGTERLVLDYVVFMGVQTLFDLFAMYASSCRCFRSEGTPYCLRVFVLPILGCCGGCASLGCVLVFLFIMGIYYAVQDLAFGEILVQSLLNKCISMGLSVFPLGLVFYMYARSCHRALPEVADGDAELGKATATPK